MNPERKTIMRYIALLIVVSAVSVVVITTALRAGSEDQGRGTAQAVFYVH